MSDTEPTATRDKERTRRAILTAAVQLMSERGSGVSMADIAAHAGVSKGALTHHFTSRDALEQEILADTLRRFWDEVHEHVDIAENRPGRLLRGYIRALTSDASGVRDVYSPAAMLLMIGNGPSVQQLLIDDAERWREAFAADGIDYDQSMALRYAAEGIGANVDTPYLTPSELASTRARLLELASN